MDSILNTVKKSIGLLDDYDVFDQTLIMHINSVFMVLQQLGVGPKEGYLITGSSNTWDEFIQDDERKEMVKTYICMKVRLMFDPPNSSLVSDACQRTAEELEWRMKFNAEGDALKNE